MTVKEKAVQHLLKPPAVEYVRLLEAATQKDPEYVNNNRVDVGNIIHGFLAGAGFHWDQEIYDKEWPEILQDALAQLSGNKS